MFKVYSFRGVDIQLIFGSRETPVTPKDFHIIGQTPDCSRFLALSLEHYDVMFEETNMIAISSTYNFTYRQEWGLTINEEVIRRVKKDLRTKELEHMIATYGNYTFDADEISQGRISRALLGMEDSETIQWTLADNTVAELTKADLSGMLRIAGMTQTKIWGKYI